ncbi:unnamed protein product [Urochloa decumbens]|uniref:COBRA-like protein n=1 Tax=Urochloa decumbens TaxID=240449 RepID=A0ABC9C857_9POAL
MLRRRVGNSIAGFGAAMGTERFVFVLFACVCCSSARFADAYDPMDPNGNITITWDFQSLDVKDANTYTVMVSIHNNQLYRHIEHPGWRLSWTWAGKEVIWASTGAEATEQGDCSRVVGSGGNRPHCCQKRPVMVDMQPGTPYNQQVANCCRGGVISSLVQDNRTSTAAFQLVVGESAAAKDGGDGKEPEMPWGFDVGVPGYSCSNASKVAPTRSKVDKNRHVQVLLTWQVTCSYSQYRESGAQSCCVSLSTFYSSDIVSCPRCSCGCQGTTTSPRCVAGGGGDPGALALPSNGEDEPAPLVRCSEHMCPIRVHWHVKVNYKKYWRVKVTVSNYNLVRNYSDWNLVLQHPNLRSLTQLFSFNYKPLIEYGTFNDTGMFWGIKFYNEMLLQDGNVQTEMILEKHEGEFTFSGGWAFPRRVYFDGHECVMPPADQYPALPNGASATRRSLVAGACLLLLSFLALV